MNVLGLQTALEYAMGIIKVEGAQMSWCVSAFRSKFIVTHNNLNVTSLCDVYC